MAANAPRRASNTAAGRILIGSLGLVAYTFVGYPAAMALAARYWKRPVRTDSSAEPKISVLVAAYNEAKVIVDRLENLRAADYPSERLELIVAADGSDDETAERARAVAGT